MLRSLRFYLSTLLGTVLLAGCCANNVCDCQDSQADAFYFKFLVDDTGANPLAFRSSEVDTVWMLRFALPLSTAARPPRDSVGFIRPAAQAGEPITLNNAAPFAAATNLKLHRYEYELQFRDRSRMLRRFRVRNIALQGAFEADGCCTCYRNSRKAAEVNGQTYDTTETNQQPVVITLGR
ncbi:hypothetical protein GCM10023185_43350 [Hymenobacter saemangeumensis]|uniref:Lipoprotein n=1 Tax=Hymenobacter saemangeumensis TaxID=1084522 RepID=A0ABP8IRZ3_9BACT